MDTKTIFACVRHKRGWCACAGTSTRYRDNVKTLCNHYIILPLGLEYRIPNCKECLEKISKNEQ